MLRFSEPIDSRLSWAIVTAPDGQRFAGKVSSPAEIQVPLQSKTSGVYNVAWSTVSLVDGHTLRGSFRFGVGVAPTAERETGAEVSLRAPDLLIAAARTVETTGLLVALGMLALHWLASRGRRIDWVRPHARMALGVAFAGGLLVVSGEAVNAAGSPSFGAAVAYLSNGLPGVARLTRLGSEALALALSFAPANIIAVPLVVAIVGLAASGHAAGVNPRWLGILVDSLHAMSAGLWAGGIIALATIRPPDGWRAPDSRALLERFTPVAIAAFLVTVALGSLRASEELASPNNLLTSTYGQILALKALAIVVMIPFSFQAWRRKLPTKRVEAALAVVVVGAASLLAAYPLPPARLAEADAGVTTLATSPALPKDGDLTLAGHAGQILVGLTIRPGRPGRNQVLVFLLPVEGEVAASIVPASISLDGRPIALRRCGSTCREGVADLRGGEHGVVDVPLESGGRAAFDLPALPAPDGAALLSRAQRRMHTLRTYRIDETLGPADPPVRTSYAFQAPDRMEMDATGGFESIWIGDVRYNRAKPGSPWQQENVGLGLQVPEFAWDVRANQSAVAPRILESTEIDGISTRIVSFYTDDGDLPTWFRLWVDSAGTVHRAEMLTQGHFMDHRYYDLDEPFTIATPIQQRH